MQGANVWVVVILGLVFCVLYELLVRVSEVKMLMEAK